MLRDVGAAGFGQRVRAALTGVGLRCDQVLVLELGERRVHRPWARPPQAAASLADLLDDLVAVERLLGKQRKRRGAHVAALRPAASPAVTARPRAERRTAVGAARERRAEFLRRHIPAVPAEYRSLGRLGGAGESHLETLAAVPMPVPQLVTVLVGIVFSAVIVHNNSLSCLVRSLSSNSLDSSTIYR